MSNSSGIQPCEDLDRAFASLRVADETDPVPPRVIKIVIRDEKLVEATREEAQGTWQEDYGALVPSLLDDSDPSYILFRFDHRDATGAFRWLLIHYVPDYAHIRQKMAYASTLASLRRAFGDSRIADELFGTSKAEVTLDGYEAHVKSAAAPPPLRDDEREKSDIKKAETGATISASSRHEVVGGVSFPFHEDARAAMEQLRDDHRQYVQLWIDISKEMIMLADSGDVTTETLQSAMPTDSPRFHFLAYPHEHAGELLRPILFVYSCPGYSCSIKERMLYASTKGGVLALADQLGVTLAVKLEITDSDDVTHDILHNEIHPPPKEESKRFLKPAAPGRGPRRMHRDRSADSLNSVQSDQE